MTTAPPARGRPVLFLAREESHALPPVLRKTGIEKRFGPVTALDGVDCTLKAGEIHALRGANGAGKSALVEILSGVHTGDGGESLIDGAAIALGGPRAAMAAGIAAVEQRPELVPDLSRVEDICLGHEGRRPAMRAAAARLLARFPVGLTAVLLGGMALKMGMPNVVGTAVGILLLAVPLSGAPAARRSEENHHEGF